MYTGVSRERARILFDMSHNLRTPLTSLQMILTNIKSDIDNIVSAEDTSSEPSTARSQTSTNNNNTTSNNNKIYTTSSAKHNNSTTNSTTNILQKIDEKYIINRDLSEEVRIMRADRTRNRKDIHNKRIGYVKSLRIECDEADVAFNQLNLLIENSLTNIQQMINTNNTNSDSNNNNNKSIYTKKCINILTTIYNIQYILSSIENENKDRFLWVLEPLKKSIIHHNSNTNNNNTNANNDSSNNDSNSDSDSNIDMLYTSEDTFKFAIISILRQLHTQHERVVITIGHNSDPQSNGDEILQSSDDIDEKIIITPGILSITITVPSPCDYNYITNTNSIDTTSPNTVTDVAPEISDLKSSSKKQHGSKLTASTSSYVGYSERTRSSYSLADFAAVGQALREASGAFDIITTKPTVLPASSSHTTDDNSNRRGSASMTNKAKGEIEFRMWLPAGVQRVVTQEPQEHQATPTLLFTPSSKSIKRCSTHDESDPTEHTPSHEPSTLQPIEPLHPTSSTNAAIPTLKTTITSTTIKPRVLIVEDSISVQKAMARFLTRAGCDVTCVVNGRLGVTELTTNVYDVVLCDFLMVCTVFLSIPLVSHLLLYMCICIFYVYSL